MKAKVELNSYGYNAAATYIARMGNNGVKTIELPPAANTHYVIHQLLKGHRKVVGAVIGAGDWPGQHLMITKWTGSRLWEHVTQCWVWCGEYWWRISENYCHATKEAWQAHMYYQCVENGWGDPSHWKTWP